MCFGLNCGSQWLLLVHRPSNPSVSDQALIYPLYRSTTRQSATNVLCLCTSFGHIPPKWGFSSVYSCSLVLIRMSKQMNAQFIFGGTTRFINHRWNMQRNFLSFGFHQGKCFFAYSFIIYLFNLSQFQELYYMVWNSTDFLDLKLKMKSLKALNYFINNKSALDVGKWVPATS